VRVLKAHRGDYAATVLACCDAMVGYERLDIVAHARWHAQHEELALRKRLALATWRQSRDAAAHAQRASAADAVAPGAPAAAAADPVKCANYPTAAIIGRICYGLPQAVKQSHE
jgi:hypothetical protein